MKLLLSGGLCGMTPHQGTIVGGLYFMMVAVMQMVFEVDHLHRVIESTNGTGDPLLPHVFEYYYYSMLAMEAATLLLAACMLGAVFAQQPLGILGFAAWLMLYNVSLVVVTSLLQVQMKAVGLEQSTLVWYGMVLRLVGDSFWLSLVITHGLEVQREKNRPGWRRRKAGNSSTIKEGAQLRLKFKAFDSSV